MATGTVFVHMVGDEDLHMKAARTELAKRLAALKGYTFAEEYDPSSPSDRAGRLYFVPSDTLLGSTAATLGITGEHDLFGGVVPDGFVATKVITHPLVHPHATAPPGWSHAFGERVRGAVLSGFSAFTREDARRAGARLLEQGPARTKPARATAGRDQTVVSSMAELESALDAMDPEEILRYGLVVEENLTEVATYSVGQVRVAELVATYHGMQRLTTDNHGAEVYGGSDLTIVRGDFEALLKLGLPDEAQLAVSQARVYDAAAFKLFAGLFASRRNYDVASGLNPQMIHRTGVLEQSWRSGGASAAEIAALEAFRANPALGAVRASTFEVYGGDEPPPGAVVYFRGTDEACGPMSRYATVEPYDGAQ